MPRILLAKGGKPGAPGLYRRLITDKNGRQVTHWTRVEARRAAYNPNQLTLDFDRDPYPSLETRPGTRPEQRAAGNAAIEALRQRLGRLRDHGGSTATLLGARLCRDFVAQGGTQLLGRRVGSAGDLAALAQIYRDPRFETFRCFYMRGDEVVGESAYSSRLPGTVRIPDAFDAQVAADMQRFGADGYYLMHNHPSGAAQPSDPDVYLTQYLATKAPGLISHVVIDHKEYATLDAGGHASIRIIQEPALVGPDFHASPAMDHPLLGSKLGNANAVAIAAKALQTDGALEKSPVLIMTKGMHAETELISSAPAALLKQARGKTARAQAWLRGVARATGAGAHRFLIVSDDDFDAYHAAGAPLIRDRSITDIVSASGRSMRHHVDPHPDAAHDLLEARRPGRQVAERQRLADDLEAQEKYLDAGARALGYASIDELATKDYPAFERLASAWREQHAVEDALYEPVAKYVQGATIDVDGVARPTTNSNGKPIHPAVEGVRNFWRWFGRSLVVDEDDNPQVMYHATSRDFAAFDRDAAKQWRGVATMDNIGSWFSDTPAEVDKYARDDGKQVMPVYLQISRPKFYDSFNEFLKDAHEAAGTRYDERNAPGRVDPAPLRKRLQAQGYDGISFAKTENAELHERLPVLAEKLKQARDAWQSADKADRPYYERVIADTLAKQKETRHLLSSYGESTEFDNQYVWVAFEPTQIKSATGNNGAFDPADATITKALPQDGLRQRASATPEDLRSRIGRTVASLRQIRRQGEAIAAGAAERLETVNARLAALRHHAVTDRAAADEYMQLTEEKGALLRTLAQS